MFEQLIYSAFEGSNTLSTGQQLSRQEFERRWDANPEIKCAELIEGCVRVGGPVKFSHGRTHACFLAWLGSYEADTPGVVSCAPASIRFDDRNMPLPDGLLMLRSGSRCRVAADDILEGAPELIVEVTTDSSSFDLQVKRGVYERQGVREYVVWRTLDGEIDWFALRQTRYERLEPDANGILKSTLFPGLWIHAKQCREPLMRALLDTLRDGLASTRGMRQ